MTQMSFEELVGDLTRESVDHFLAPNDPVGQPVLYSVEVQGSARYLRVCLLDVKPGFGWGYKVIDEDAGPCAKNCPVRLLDACSPPASAGAARWREQVRGAMGSA